MNAWLRFSWVASVAVMASIAACSSSSDGDNGSTSSSSGSSSGNVGCAADPRVATFASGLKAQSASGRFVAEIVTATPAPPHEGAGEAGMNTWTMRLTLDGKPVGDAVLIEAKMPDHGHNSPKTPVATANPDGTTNVDTIFLFMGGVWEITFTPKGAAEPASFMLCVER